MHQIQESINKMLLFQKGLQEVGSIISMTSNNKNRSNESNATRESFKRKSDTLKKATKNMEPKQIKAKQTQKTNNKGGKGIVDDTAQNKKIDDKIIIKRK